MSIYEESMSALERVGCQFFACNGPFVRYQPMRSCYVCQALRRLYRRRGAYSTLYPKA